MNSAELECEWHGIDLERVTERYGSTAGWVEALRGEAAEAARGHEVYFLARGDQVKIGTSRNVAARMAQLGHTLDDVLAVIPGGVTRERRLQRELKHLRVRGEWFLAADEVLDVIQREVVSP